MMTTIFLIAAIGSVIVAVWCVLFGRDENILFGKLFDNAWCFDETPPQIGGAFMKLVEIVTGAAVMISITYLCDMYLLGNVSHTLAVVITSFIGFIGLAVYALGIWEFIYLVVYFVLALFCIILALLEDIYNLLFKKNNEH